MGNIPKITAYLNQPPTVFAPPEMSRPMPSIVPQEARLQRTTAAKISFMIYPIIQTTRLRVETPASHRRWVIFLENAMTYYGLCAKNYYTRRE